MPNINLLVGRKIFHQNVHTTNGSEKEITVIATKFEKGHPSSPYEIHYCEFGGWCFNEEEYRKLIKVMKHGQAELKFRSLDDEWEVYATDS